MKDVYVIQSKLYGIIGAANTKSKADKFAELFVDKMCKNCNTSIVYHERSYELANGERVYVEKIPVYATKARFVRDW